MGCTLNLHGGFPKLGVLFWGSPIIRILVFLGLDWGPLIEGNYQIWGVPIVRIIVFWGVCWGPLIQGNYQNPIGSAVNPPRLLGSYRRSLAWMMT